MPKYLLIYLINIIKTTFPLCLLVAQLDVQAGLLESRISTSSSIRPPFLQDNALNYWHHSQHSQRAIHISYPDGWWAEGLSEVGRCGNLNNHALKFKYTADKTDFRTLELYQTTYDCKTVIAKSFSIQVMFVHSLNELVVPFKAFQGANLSLGHSVILRGPLTLHQMELVNSASAYGLGVPTAEMMLGISNNDPEIVVQVFPNFEQSHSMPVLYHDHISVDPVVIEKSDVFEEYLAGPGECVDMTNTMIRITYSASYSGQRKVSLENKVYICENPLTNTVDAQIMFLQGTNLQVNVPHFAFRGSDLVLGHYIYIRGPLTIHRVDIVHASSRMTEPFEVKRINSPPSIMIDNFSDWSDPRTNSEGHERTGSDKIIHSPNDNFITLKDSSDSWTEHIVGPGKTFDMSNCAFQITYTTSVSAPRHVTLLQAFGLNVYDRLVQWYQRSRPVSVHIYANVMLFAGVRRRAVLPISVFDKNNPNYNPANVYGLILQGPLIIHSIEIIHNGAQKSSKSPRAPSQSLIGRPTVIRDYVSDARAEMLNIMMYNSLSNLQAPLVSPRLDLDTPADQYVEAFSHELSDGKNAFRITYSADKTGPRRLECSFQYSPGTANVVFREGTNKMIVVPFAVFGRPRLTPIHSLAIAGPLSISKVELVTTSQTSEQLHAFDGGRYMFVDRSSIYRDAYDFFMSFCDRDFRLLLLKVSFYGENGTDNGGLRREFFSLLSAEISNSARGLFISSAETNYALEINPESAHINGFLNEFRFVGRIIGFAISYPEVLDINFAVSIYKMILRKSMSILDLKSLDPIVYKNLIKIRDIDVSGLGLFMLPDTNCGIRGLTEHKWCGDDIPVTNQNKELYIKRYWQHRVYKSVQAQASEMRRGILDIVPEAWLNRMKAVDLMRAVGGIVIIDVDDWKAHTRYKGFFESNSKTILLFWELVSEWDNKQRSLLLRYVTGSPRLPITGFSGLSHQFTIKDVGYLGVEHLPCARTCVNTLDLPRYESMEVLRAKLIYAMDEGFMFGIS